MWFFGWGFSRGRAFCVVCILLFDGGILGVLLCEEDLLGG